MTKDNEKLILQILNGEGACKTTAIRKFAAQNNVPVLRPNTASLLISLIRTKQPLRILEIGTAIGYSGTLILENAPQGALLHTLEKDESTANIARKNFEQLGLSNFATVLVGDALDTLSTLEEPYDFIFLDGPKGQYIKYLPHLIRLLKQNGVLFADNVLRAGLVLQTEPVPANKRAMVNHLKQFLIEISEHPNLQSQIIDLEDGVSISIKRN